MHQVHPVPEIFLLPSSIPFLVFLLSPLQMFLLIPSWGDGIATWKWEKLNVFTTS